MPQPLCMCTVLLKLAKVERLKIRKFWVQVLLITVIISTWTQNFPIFNRSTLASFNNTVHIHVHEGCGMLL